MAKPGILFVGLGRMGWPMAARLAAADYRLAVADADQSRVAHFTRDFSASAGPPAEFSPEILITMLPTSAIVAEVLFGSGGVAGQIEPGGVVIEMSSGEPQATQLLGKRLAERGCSIVDAPVSGGVQRAETGELSIMLGGNEDVCERVTPILSSLGSTVTRTGTLGSAHAMKALNNLVSAAGLLVSIEALAVGRRFGLDPSRMVDILNASTGMNNSTQKKLKQFVLSKTYDSGFSLDLMAKDLTIALNLAQNIKCPVPFSSLCRELVASAASVLGPGRDHTELAKLSELLTGVEL